MLNKVGELVDRAVDRLFPEDYECSICHDEGFVYQDLFDNRETVPCVCVKEQELERLEEDANSQKKNE